MDTAQTTQATTTPLPISQDLRGVPEPVARIQAILNSEHEPQAQPAQEQPSAPPAQPEAEVPAGPNKQVEAETTEDARQYAEIPLDQLEAIELEVTVKGEGGSDVVEKLPVKALREGYMRQKDYQRKTAELARQREAEAETRRQAIEGERTAYQASLREAYDLMLESVSPELKNANWDALAKDNPFEFVRLTNEREKLQRGLAAIQAKQKEVSEKQKTEQTKAMQAMAAKARETLESEIPGWNDTLYQSLMRAGEKHGYKPEEVATWVDARAIKLLYKANQFDQLQAEKKTPAADKRVVVPPKVVKPGTPQASPQAQKEQNAMAQLQKSGRIDDAAAVLRARNR